MFNIENIIRPNIKSLIPYSSARAEYKNTDGIFLDANENPFGNNNRYPDPYQTQLKNKLSELKNIPINNIFIGNGSDEIIDLLFRIFCRPRIDKTVIFSPTYGMYRVSAAINDVACIDIPLNQEFQIKSNSAREILNMENVKLVFICSPNNPTGNSLNRENIDAILRSFKGIVIIDEAYIDFSDLASWKEKIMQYPNLIVLQTMSKAWGLAGARIGMAFADQKIIRYLNKVKPPYNVSQLNQDAAIKAITNKSQYDQNLAILKTEKAKLQKELQTLPIVLKIYSSDANFLLVKMRNAEKIYRYLIRKNIITRNRDALVQSCLRITVGSPDENNRLIKNMSNQTTNK